MLIRNTKEDYLFEFRQWRRNHRQRITISSITHKKITHIEILLMNEKKIRPRENSRLSILQQSKAFSLMLQIGMIQYNNVGTYLFVVLADYPIREFTSGIYAMRKFYISLVVWKTDLGHEKQRKKVKFSHSIDWQITISNILSILIREVFVRPYKKEWTLFFLSSMIPYQIYEGVKR